MPKIKLCKDCIHFEIEPGEDPVCNIPSEVQTHDLVLGTVTLTLLRDPYEERQHYGCNEDRCGTQGKYWEERCTADLPYNLIEDED